MKNLLSTQLLVLLCLLVNITSKSQNLGFEDGNFNNWSLAYGENNRKATLLFFPICWNKKIKDLTNGQNSPDYHQIMTAGFDPIVGGTILPTVIEGNFSARIGSRGSVGKKASIIERNVTIPNDGVLKINYAVVMNDPSHNKCQKPFFSIRVSSLSGSTIFFEEYYSNTNNSKFKPFAGGVYKNWDCEGIKLSNYKNQNVKVQFTTADCSQGATSHATYVYLDAFGADTLTPEFTTLKSTYCDGESITADASASFGETSYFWSIEESDENGKRYPSTEVSKWFTNAEAGSINLSNLYNDLGGVFKCNTYYRIKLAVSNDCVPWKATTKLINISCPKANAGPDVCCSNNSLQILGGSLPNPNYTYEWFPKYGLSKPYASITNLDCTNEEIREQGDCFEYTLKVTDQYGCEAEDKVRVFFEPPKFNIRQESACCGIKLSIQDDGCYSSISWSNGEKDVRSITIDQAGTYSVNLSNSCGDTLKSVTITNVDLIEEFKKIYPKFIAGAAFTPNNDGVNDELEIFHYASDAPLKGDPIAYNATDYELYVVDRNGTVHLVSSGTTCTGFRNGEIKWDGKINGQLVQDGVYTYFVKVKNCDYPWIQADIITGVEFECIDCGFTLIGDRHCPGFFNGCKEFGEKQISSTRPSVTVFR